MKIRMMKQVNIEAKTLKIHIKFVDQFSASIVDQDGQEIWEQEDGYVPGFMPGPHYGDYLILDIDLDSGQVTNWRTPGADEIEALVNNQAGE